jgi:hypothetical protein
MRGNSLGFFGLNKGGRAALKRSKKPGREQRPGFLVLGIWSLFLLGRLLFAGRLVVGVRLVCFFLSLSSWVGMLGGFDGGCHGQWEG